MHDGDLRDARRRQPRLVREEPAALDEHLALVKQVRAARLDEIDQRQLVLLCDLLRAKRLFQTHGGDGAALDRAVARENEDPLAGDDADADDAAAAHDAGRAIIVMHAEARKRGQLQKRRAVVEKPSDALPRQELAPLCEPLGLLRRMRDHGPFKAAEFFHLRQEMRGVGLEGFRLRRYPRGDHRHGRRPPRLIACHPFSGFRASWRDGSPEIPARGCMRPYPSAHYARAQPRRWARSRRK